MGNVINEEVKIIAPAETKEEKQTRARNLLNEALAQNPTAAVVLCRTAEDTMMVASVGDRSEIETLILTGGISLFNSIEKTRNDMPDAKPGPHGPH